MSYPHLGAATAEFSLGAFEIPPLQLIPRAGGLLHTLSSRGSGAVVGDALPEIERLVCRLHSIQQQRFLPGRFRLASRGWRPAFGIAGNVRRKMRDEVGTPLPLGEIVTPVSPVAGEIRDTGLPVEPAGGGPKVFEQHLNNLFFVQPAPVVMGGQVFADYILSLPKAQRPKTAAYAELDDPFSAPIAENIRKRFEAAGIKTVYHQTYPSESADLTPIIAGVAAAKPDAVVSGTQRTAASTALDATVPARWPARPPQAGHIVRIREAQILKRSLT